MKLLRTIRFDPSDTRVFDHAAPEGDWAVSGAFAFSDLAPEDCTGKIGQAFRSGFLGLPSLGRSTFVTVARADSTARDAALAALIRHFVEDWGAPSAEAARPVAEAELAFAEDLCAEAAPGTVFAVSRGHDAEGRITETIRTIPRPGNCGQARVWDIFEEPAE